MLKATKEVLEKKFGSMSSEIYIYSMETVIREHLNCTINRGNPTPENMNSILQTNIDFFRKHLSEV